MKGQEQKKTVKKEKMDRKMPKALSEYQLEKKSKSSNTLGKA